MFSVNYTKFYLYIHIKVDFLERFNNESISKNALFETAGHPQPSGVPLGYISVSDTGSQE